MSEKMMTFDEFRAAAAQSEPIGEAVRQQLRHVADTPAADALLRSHTLGNMDGWIPWAVNDCTTA
ncbi:MAG TPA: hypothetical protein VHW00_01555 [Thermoanaerobaculia bacterium]|nr:hypothetical protein [Thermoanaerobaculia bacterium]